MTIRERAGDFLSPPTAPLLLHVLPGFGAGGAQSRIVVLLNRLGSAFRHVIVSLNNDLGAADRIDPSVDACCLGFRVDANPVTAVKQLAGLLRQRRPALLLTYNWGSIEAVAAARLSHVCPVIHTEDGFGDEEATKQKARRVFTRRLVLRGVNRVIAPSLRLEAIMRSLWRLPSRVVKYLPNGVDTTFYLPASHARRPNSELVVGTVGQLRPEKRQEDLIKLCAQLQREVPVKLRIAGDGPERERLENCARQTDLGDRVEFLGQVRDLRSFYAGLDLFILTSSTEQMPMTVLEAMSSGVAVISTDVGDVKQMVCTENAPFIVPAGPSLVEAAKSLAANDKLRSALGVANRCRCVEHYSLEKMVDIYRKLYESAVGDEAFKA